MARGAQSGWTGLRADDRGARLASLLFDFRRILGLDTLAGRLKPMRRYGRTWEPGASEWTWWENPPVGAKDPLGAYPARSPGSAETFPKRIAPGGPPQGWLRVVVSLRVQYSCVGTGMIPVAQGVGSRPRAVVAASRSKPRWTARVPATVFYGHSACWPM